MSAQRYKATNGYGGDSDLVADDTGGIVLHSDYAALEARCAGLERERDALRKGMAWWRSRHHTLHREATDTVLVVNRNFVKALHRAESAGAERDALQAKLAAAEARADAFHASLVKARPCGVCGGNKQIVSKRSQEIEMCPGCNGYGFDLAILAGHAPATSQTDLIHAVIHRAVLDVIAATGAYLPPDGIDAQECINRVLQATDNAAVVSALNELERNPYKLPRTVQAAPSDREKRLEAALQGIADIYGAHQAVTKCRDIARAALADTNNNDDTTRK